MWGKTHSEGVKNKLRVINSDGRHKGANNSQYGVSPRQRMKENVYLLWLAKHRESAKGIRNSQYGISPKERMSEQTYKHWLSCQNKGTLGENPNAKSVLMYKASFSKEFSSLKECALYMQEYFCRKGSKIISIQNNLSAAIKNNKKYYSFNFKFI